MERAKGRGRGGAEAETLPLMLAVERDDVGSMTGDEVGSKVLTEAAELRNARCSHADMMRSRVG